jgi:hypothetical protein
MILKDMFVKPIDRDIKGVIKVGQGDAENIRQELEEYVVTRELQKHFAQFFTSYKKGINGNTDKMGVWISGFFGSGKSHFLKILSYLLENKEVGGKRALEYFLEDNKISDPMVLADMKLVAGSAPSTDVVLFNIDSKSDMSSKHNKDAIVSVFLKVFNEMQGYIGSMPYLADLERHLDELGKYVDFMNTYERISGSKWIESRHKFDFVQDDIVDALVEMGFMSEPAARNWCEKSTESYSISIEDFAKLVKEYIKRKGGNHRVVFLVDEVGQYIGDDSKLMLNLQTLTEDLGTACHGKAWVIVTSQQDIDAIAKDMGLRSNDFSKIQGRFDTRISMSSANVDEVIKKRILEKTVTADQTLKVVYEQKSTLIKNLILFTDKAEKKLYHNDHEFSGIYPFVPYQFDLLGSVLTSIRTHGASGKHLSEGERSMIALFKESAMKLMYHEAGALIPFNVFYDALHQFLDHSHKGVIIKAHDNGFINPDKEDDCFNVNVLKTLFMIKYVKEITANLDNITSLMVDSIDTDRISLKKKVEQALKVLADQTLIQKHGELYVFLTNEEQEINREIDNQNIEMAEVIGKVSELIFEDIFSDKKYRYPAFNGRYSFGFNQIVDDRPYKANQGFDIGVRILTPNSDFVSDETTLRMMAGQGREVLVVLPSDSSFIDEIRKSLKIEKYLRHASTTNLSKLEQIKEAKRSEMRERKDNAKLFLVENMKSADIYVNGDKAQIGSKDVSARINEAISKLVSAVYHKLDYIDVAMSEANIRALFSSSAQHRFTLEGDKEANEHALSDVLKYIENNSAAHMKTSMKTLLDRFMKAPYGYVEDDVEWLVAKLFKNGQISFTVNGSSVTMLNKTEDELVRYITKKEFVDKLLTERRETIPQLWKKSAREVIKEIFGASVTSEDDDSMMSAYRTYSQNLINDLEKIEIMQKSAALPGKNVISTGKGLLKTTNQIQNPFEFFEKLHNDRGIFFKLAEELEPIRAFYNGEQKTIFEKALFSMHIFDDSKTFIVNDAVEGYVVQVKEILKKELPYKEIHKLPDLIDKFNNAYLSILTSMEKPILDAVNEAKNIVFNELNQRVYKDELSNRFDQLFYEITKKATECNNVATLQNIKVEADALKVRLLNEIAKKDVEIIGPGPGPTPPPYKKQKHISIKSINISSSWQIENTEDIEKHLMSLRNQLIKQLEENTVINIEF